MLNWEQIVDTIVSWGNWMIQAIISIPLPFLLAFKFLKWLTVKLGEERAVNAINEFIDKKIEAAGGIKTFGKRIFPRFVDLFGWIWNNLGKTAVVYFLFLITLAFFQNGSGTSPEPTTIPTLIPTSTRTPTMTPTLTSTPTPTRDLSLQGECKPQPMPKNIPCQYEAISPNTDSPYEIASFLFGRNTELAERYAGAIYELLRNENGYYGGTTNGSRVLERDGWVVIPPIDEVHDLEYYREYLRYEICGIDVERPCLYVVSEQTAIDGINDYKSIAQYFGNSVQCVEKANRTTFVNSKNYPDEVTDLEDGVVLIIPREENDCEYL